MSLASLRRHPPHKRKTYDRALRKWRFENIQKLDIEDLENQAQTLVENAKVPVTVDYIAKQLHIAWDTARSLLLSLAVKGRVSATKTMKSWIFQPTPEKKGILA